MVLENAIAMIAACKQNDGLLLPLLEDINAEYGYLPEEVLRMISSELGYHLSQLYSLATFYDVFRFESGGRHLIHVCQGTACHVHGARNILGTIENELGVKEGQTTNDLQFTVETVRCMGCCSHAPVLRVDDETYGKTDASKIPDILKEYKLKEL